MESKPQNLSRVLWSPGNTFSLYRSLAVFAGTSPSRLSLSWDFLLVYFHVDHLPLISRGTVMVPFLLDAHIMTLDSVLSELCFPVSCIRALFPSVRSGP